MNRPQMDMLDSSAGGADLGWNGPTIKEILEKVDLFNVTVEDGDSDDTVKREKVLVKRNRAPTANVSSSKTVVSSSFPESAFLGPRPWGKPISLQSTQVEEEEFTIMNIDEFLNENNISLDSEDPVLPHQFSRHNRDSTHSCSSSSSGSSINEDTEHQGREVMGARRHNVIPKDVPNDFLYVESKRARTEREKEEKRQQKQIMEIDFPPEDLALATVPGADFDPRRRVFSTEELKPQPIIRKRKKHLVPTESKDNRYWEKREKNNVAARRSREARRLKENQIALRAAFLERENNLLKMQMGEMRNDNERLVAEKRQLQERVARYTL